MKVMIILPNLNPSVHLFNLSLVCLPYKHTPSLHSNSLIHSLTHSCTYSLTHSFIHSLTHSHTHTHTLPHSLPHSRTHTHTHTLTHSLHCTVSPLLFLPYPVLCGDTSPCNPHSTRALSHYPHDALLSTSPSSPSLFLSPFLCLFLCLSHLCLHRFHCHPYVAM